MGDYSNKSMQQLLDAVLGVDPQKWQHAADTWGSMATGINDTQANLDDAWNKTEVFHRNGPDSAAFTAFNDNVTWSRQSTASWSTFAADVHNRLANTAGAIGQVAQKVGAAASDYFVADNIYRNAMADGARGTATEAFNKMQQLHSTAVFAMNSLGTVIDRTFDGITTAPHAKYNGPMTPKQGNGEPGTGDPNDQGAGAGAGTGAGAGDGAGVGGGEQPAKTPGDTPETPKEPEVKDPVEEAGKFIDVVGKGIDLVGKVPENLNKWLTLAQSAKDLLGSDTTTPQVLNPKDLLPDGPVPDGTGMPILSGDYGTAPTFDPGKFVQPGGTPAGIGGLPSVGSLPSLGGIDSGKVGVHPAGTADRGGASSSKSTVAGGPGSAPSLAGQTSTSSTAAQQSSSPMYPPPMGGGMGAGGNSVKGDIKSGAAPSRPGFSVPAEQTEAERLRRHGVQSELQGRANGEQATGAVPARKRKRDVRVGKTTERDVLDEELWRL